MGLVCKIAGHKWYKTPDGRDGCTCSRCGAPNPDGVHDRHKEPGNCYAVCSWCGSRELRHEWNGCTCTWCGAKLDSNHKWEFVPGSCDFKCSVCGTIRKDRKNHKWAGCRCTLCGAVRNKDHDFAPAAEDGIPSCTVCGISVDESLAQSAVEALREKRDGYYSYACDLLRQIKTPECILSIAPYMPYQAFGRLGQLGADEELAAVARGIRGGYGYEMKQEARRNIQDAALRESINVEMTEEERRWYEIDTKSGM